MLKIKIIDKPVETRYEGFPPEIAMAMFDEMMAMQELIDNGVR